MTQLSSLQAFLPPSSCMEPPVWCGVLEVGTWGCFVKDGGYGCLGKLSEKSGELKMSEAIMPEKPLVTSELMTCLLIRSLKQSWGNTPFNLVINSLTSDFKGSAAILNSNCVPDLGLYALCKMSLLLSQPPPGGMIGETKGKSELLQRDHLSVVFPWAEPDCERH